MTPIAATKTCLRKYATFSGRAQRGEFWWFLLIAIGASMTVSALARLVVDAPGNSDRIDMAVSLIIFLPLVAAGFRRLHDSGRSGALMVLAIAASVGGKFLTLGSILNIPLMAPLATGRAAVAVALSVSALFILWPIAVLASPSQPFANRYGPNPHEVPS